MKKHRDGSISVKPVISPKPYHTIRWLLEERMAKDSGAPAVHLQRALSGEWHALTIEEFVADVYRMARALAGLGFKHGDRIGILASTSYQWLLLDCAALHIGVITVPIYETNSRHQIDWMVEDSGIRQIFTDTRAHATITDSVTEGRIPPAIVMEEGWREKLDIEGAKVSDKELKAMMEAVVSDDIATVIYTSGTTGRPKGVQLTQGNFVHTILASQKSVPEITMNPKGKLLLFLPMAHVMGRIVAYMGVTCRISTGFVGNMHNLLSDLDSFKPTLLVVVPRVLEKIYNASEAKAGAGFKRKIFRWAADIAVQDSRKTFKGPWFMMKRAFARKAVHSKIREAMGGHIEFAISAGAPLGTRLGHFFRGIGLTVVEGYGLTETTGPAVATRAAKPVLGTVGIPFPGMSVKIASDGEVLLKGLGLFPGYLNDEKTTREALRDGWFHTGDLGELDAKGNLTITGRKKHLIVTAGGKNVSPAILEDKLASHPLISQVVVVGDRRPFVGALITLDTQMLPSWLKSHGEEKMPASEAMKNKAVLDSLQRAIDRTNKQVSRAESIRKFVILPGDFTQDNGLLTPSLKVRRDKVLREYHDVIDELYGGPEGEEKFADKKHHK
ncbi:AMP-dependent synthetase/ligase [Actinotignum urinale]|uniref:Acyl-CoA synthetase n=1 Tax=Actinotignum urinale TaxID=190146 RepID=A0ABU5GC87_9ACTO|nr:AMP-dependent synthetase/ligase [Actinotignum urinale]MDY5133706.1 AMP-dependent synthetase/ligase [Actinotignum urinale]